VASVVRKELVVHRQDELAQAVPQVHGGGRLGVARGARPVCSGLHERLVLQEAVEEGAALEGLLLKIQRMEKVAYRCIGLLRSAFVKILRFGRGVLLASERFAANCTKGLCSREGEKSARPIAPCRKNRNRSKMVKQTFSRAAGGMRPLCTSFTERLVL
jgi:hypothetical protein